MKGDEIGQGPSRGPASSKHSVLGGVKGRSMSWETPTCIGRSGFIPGRTASALGT